jgi:hypothetical protein
MNQNRSYMGLGILLLFAGVLLLLQNLGFLGPVAVNLVWVLLFGLGGVAFLLVFFFNREQWWALIPGCTLLGLTFMIGFGDRLGELSAGIFMASIGLSFLLIALLHPEHWWAIIPSGSLFSVAAMIVIAGTGLAGASLGVLFLGMALTFLAVYFSPADRERKRWALIPSGILALMGILALFTLSGLMVMNYLWPIGLIIGGAYLLWRTIQMRGQ